MKSSKMRRDLHIYSWLILADYSNKFCEADLPVLGGVDCIHHNINLRLSQPHAQLVQPASKLRLPPESTGNKKLVWNAVVPISPEQGATALRRRCLCRPRQSQ
eukprot:SAG31_NODE_12612_length_929_cov_1.497590_1_plen_103_part_00